MVARFLVVVAVVALTACGHVSKRNDSNSSMGGVGVGGAGGIGGEGAGGGEVLDPCQSPAPPEVPLRALHEAELRNELSVFGQPLDGEVYQPAVSRLFDLEPEPSATLPFVQGHAEFVSGLARRVTADPPGFVKLVGCTGQRMDSEACKNKLFEFVINRLFRGRRDDETTTELQQAFEAGQTLGGDFQSGVRAVLEVALQSPEFLYRPELGRAVEGRSAEWAQPTDLEMASRLSFLFWDRGPDDELLAAAANGGLTEPMDLERQARRLLADERAKSVITRFYRELMSSGEAHFGAGASDFSPAVLELMDQEFAGFVTRATFEGAGDFRALFAPNSWLNAQLAGYYGLPGVEGDAFRAVALDSSKYAGILTQPAWLTRASLTSFTNPSRRGWVISRSFLCSGVPAEPSAVSDHEPPPVPGKTTRQRLAEHTSNPACAGCHRLIDPVGFALEHIDATGRYRETEDGLVIDASGELYGGAGSFDGAVELAALLADSPEAHDCLVTQWQRFAFGHIEEQTNECTASELREQFAATDNVIELLVSLTQTDSFRFRKVQP
jgi:hypothetical protein